MTGSATMGQAPISGWERQRFGRRQPVLTVCQTIASLHGSEPLMYLGDDFSAPIKGDAGDEWNLSGKNAAEAK
jgi:hypothetical protein